MLQSCVLKQFMDSLADECPARSLGGTNRIANEVEANANAA
jgi:hypothetical protein